MIHVHYIDISSCGRELPQHYAATSQIHPSSPTRTSRSSSADHPFFSKGQEEQSIVIDYKHVQWKRDHGSCSVCLVHNTLTKALVLGIYHIQVWPHKRGHAKVSLVYEQGEIMTLLVASKLH
jgi:hypothetical protein